MAVSAEREEGGMRVNGLGPLYNDHNDGITMKTSEIPTTLSMARCKSYQRCWGRCRARSTRAASPP